MSKKYLVWLEPAKSGEEGPVDPDYGIEGPGDGGEGGGGGAHPMPPIAELPSLPGIPVQPLPPEKPKPPVVEGGNKPAGVPILPMDPNWKPPASGPHPPGDWVTVDAGKGQPPAWAYVPKDDGLGGGETPTPKPAGGPQGHWVPLGKTPKSTDPVWAWVPEIGAQYGIKPPAAQPK